MYYTNKESELEKLRKEVSILKKKYETFYDELPDLLRTINTDGIILDCNKAYIESLGYSKDEIIGKSVFDFVPEKSRESFLDSFEAWKKTGSVRNKMVWFKRKDRTAFPALLSANNLYDENGILIGSNTIIKDITEMYDARQRMEETQMRLGEQLATVKKSYNLLVSAERKYRNLYDKSPSLMRTVGLDGITVNCNEAYLNVLGYSKEEVIGKSIFDHTAEMSLDDMKRDFDKWKEDHEILPKEFWLKRKEGTIFPTLLTGTSLYNENGDMVGITVAFTDLTEIFEARQKIEEREAQISDQYEELKKLDESKDQFASMMSHELKTPLTPIVGWCQVLRNPKIMGALTPKQLQAIDTILTNARRLQVLISDMLDAQKLGMNKMRFDSKYVDVAELMNYMIKNLQNAMEPKQIQFINSTKEKLLIKSDRARLEQVLNNLILNAVDFVPKEEGRIEISAQNKDKQVLFFIKDNGIGIPKNKQVKLFNEFYQIDTSATRKHGGSGLGLAICKGIVLALGGEIWLESEEHKGATFYFTIPKDAKTDKVGIPK